MKKYKEKLNKLVETVKLKFEKGLVAITDVYESQLILDKYKTDTKFTEIYSNMFVTLFGLTLESLNSLALEYDFKKEYSDITESMKEIQTTINSLSEKIDLLLVENSDLRDNYWRLNQSLLKGKKN